MSSEAHRRAVKAYRLRHRAAGLCVECFRPAVTVNFCARHAAYQRRWHAEKLKMLGGRGCDDSP